MSTHRSRTSARRLTDLTLIAALCLIETLLLCAGLIAGIAATITRYATASLIIVIADTVVAVVLPLIWAVIYSRVEIVTIQPASETHR